MSSQNKDILAGFLALALLAGLVIWVCFFGGEIDTGCR